MEKINYKELDLKIGLEIHRQINTGKLFCRCPSILTEDKPDFIIERRLRPIVSELGERDIVAEYETAKSKYGIYEGHYVNTCELELDECPPFEINKEALRAVLQVARIFNAKILDTIQIMRKQVLDYSNVSSFQRGGLVSVDGYIKTKSGNVEINTIILEEDAARKTNETENSITYRLDRLGFALIEITTAPQITTPEQAKEVAEYIGMVLKSTKKFKSGIGTIREDINLSIKDSPRVELKGVQDLRNIPKIIENEVERQLSLIKQGKEVESGVRKINLDLTSTYLRPLPGKARIYPESDIPLIFITKEQKNNIKIPELISDKTAKLEEKHNLSKELANEIVKENKIELFENFTNKFKNLNPGLIAHIIIETPKEIESKFNIKTEKLSENIFSLILENLNSGKISKNSIIDILLDYIKTEKLDFNKYKIINREDLEKEIKDIIERNKDLSFGAIMGIIMSKYKNTVDGKLASELIKKYKR